MAQRSRRITFLVVAVVAVTIGHYATQLEAQSAHDIFRRLYYLPIIFGAYWFGARGGLATAGIVVALFAPHVLFQWHETPLSNAEQYLEMLMYLVVGSVTGALAQKEQKQRDQLRQANTELAQANAKLERTNVELEQANAKHERTNLQLERTNAELEQANAKLERTNAELAQANARLAQASAEIEEAYGQLKQQSVALLEAEEQIRRADRLAILGELSAIAAHEIRNPLGSIKGTAEIFRDSLGPDHKLHEFAKILVKETDRLDRILGDFLQVAGGKAGDVRGEELSSVVDQVIRLTSERARLASVTITKSIPSVPKVAMPAGALHQVLLNLLLNAIQACAPEGRISVTAAVGTARGQRQGCAEQVVQVAVSDDGPGVPRELRGRIFDPFFTTKQGGTGLGLAICQRIMAGHRGVIHVEAAVPRGARFLIEIPVARCEAGEADALAEVGT